MACDVHIQDASATSCRSPPWLSSAFLCFRGSRSGPRTLGLIFSPHLPGRPGFLTYRLLPWLFHERRFVLVTAPLRFVDFRLPRDLFTSLEILCRAWFPAGRHDGRPRRPEPRALPAVPLDAPSSVRCAHEFSRCDCHRATAARPLLSCADFGPAPSLQAASPAGAEGGAPPIPLLHLGGLLGLAQLRAA